MALCRSCGAVIIWAQTENGKRIPLDAESEKRFVALCRIEDDTPVVALRHTHLSHFATCPNASAHRKPKEPAT